jgi:fatty acid desaturase
MEHLLVLLFLLAIASAVLGVPGFVIAQRRGLSNSWIAFVPFVGLWIVLCESVDRSGWFALLTLFPLGGFVISVWMAVAVPVAHGRSRWWGAALLVPGPNIVGYWAYAFTLPSAPALQLADVI